jgi:dTDP-4-amino-4,6-dideoxygalactose transaminase
LEEKEIMIPISKPVLDDAETEAIKSVLDSGMLAQGKFVERFEERFAGLH